MSLFRYGSSGISLKALLENPELQNPQNFNTGVADLKKPGSNVASVPNHGSAFLGPNLWERPSDDNNDFDFEYMDLDEFLSENGIAVDIDVPEEQPQVSLLEEALTGSPQRLSPKLEGSELQLKIDPPSPPRRTHHSPSPQSECSPKPQMSPGLYFPESPVSQSPSSPFGLSLSPVSPAEPTETIEQCILKGLLEESPGIKEEKSDSRKRKSDVEFEVEPDELSLVTIPVLASPRSPYSIPSVYSDEQRNSDDPDKTDISLVSVPGQDNFNPKERRFTDEELKPQPMIKKSKKVFVPDDNKDEKYWNRRKKNNVAAKRSRDARRVKENQIAMRAAFLEKQNDAMQIELEAALAENKQLKKRLAKYESGL